MKHQTKETVLITITRNCSFVLKSLQIVFIFPWNWWKKRKFIQFHALSLHDVLLFLTFNRNIFLIYLNSVSFLTISPWKITGKKVFSSRGFPAVQNERGQMTMGNNNASKLLAKWTLSLDENKIRFN